MDKIFNNISNSVNIPKNNIENNEQLDLTTEIANENDWEFFKKIRLEAIENDPMAFYVTKESKAMENSKSDKEWKNELEEESSFVVLSKNKNIPIGMAQAFVRIEEENQWHIKGVYLNKNFRGSGCGKEIINLTLNEIKNRGGKSLTLNVMDTQEIARNIYEKLGFQVYRRFDSQKIDGIEYPGGQWMFKKI